MLEPKTRELCEGPNFGALTTLFAHGGPQTGVMWVGCDDEHVLINTEIHRAKYKNMMRDGRVSVAIWDAQNPYSYVEVRGTVVDTIGGDQARANIDEMSRKYTGGNYTPEITSERVIVRIRPDRQIGA
jgi:PPOX class probable F420-dependent enzyme